MKKYIDMDDLIELLSDMQGRCGTRAELRQNSKIWQQVKDMPTADVVPVRHGKWKQWDGYGYEDTYECTECGEPFVLIEGTPLQNGYNYCPNCGARMDAERKEE